ncbi:MAG: hypothetical protein KBG17_02690 [Paludibacteraceae bacterium]|nr:hypothetical protein [Paludibacteraceae bacterium]
MKGLSRNKWQRDFLLEIFMLNRLIEAFGIKPKTIKSYHFVEELLYFGMKAAQ